MKKNSNHPGRFAVLIAYQSLNKLYAHLRKNMRHILLAVTIVFLGFLAVVTVWVKSEREAGVNAVVIPTSSMAPAIPVGSLVIIAPSRTYSIGDIIRYRSRGKDTNIPLNVYVTHRIVSIDASNSTTHFVTKGDNNSVPDIVKVAVGDVSGKVVFAVPYAGYLVQFLGTRFGFILLIALPAILLIHDQIAHVRNLIKNEFS